VIEQAADEAVQFQQHLESKAQIYEKAANASGVDRIIIGSGKESFRFKDDLHNPFVANPYFVEWLPLTKNPDCYLEIEPGKTPILWRHVPDDYWHSAPPAIPEYCAGFLDIRDFSDEPGFNLSGAVFIGPEDAAIASDKRNPESVMSVINYHRAWKTDYELSAMHAASHLAVRGHVAAKQAFYEGLSEYDIHMAYLAAINCQDGELPYASIVGLNENAAVLHHMLLQKKAPTDARSMLIDAGAACRGYAADISRTYCKHGGLAEFQALIDGVDRVQLELVEMVKPGVVYTDIHYATHRLLANLLTEIGLLRCSAEEAVETGLSSVFLPHGVGHLLGVQVHDQGGHYKNEAGELNPPPVEHPALRCTRTIEENMAFTIEPGIYFIEKLLAPHLDNPAISNSLLQALSPYGGVRIEDNVVANKQGVINMTRNAFAAL